MLVSYELNVDNPHRAVNDGTGSDNDATAQATNGAERHGTVGDVNADGHTNGNDCSRLRIIKCDSFTLRGWRSTSRQIRTRRAHNSTEANIPVRALPHDDREQIGYGRTVRQQPPDSGRSSSAIGASELGSPRSGATGPPTTNLRPPTCQSPLAVVIGRVGAMPEPHPTPSPHSARCPGSGICRCAQPAVVARRNTNHQRLRGIDAANRGTALRRKTRRRPHQRQRQRVPAYHVVKQRYLAGPRDYSPPLPASSNVVAQWYDLVAAQCQEVGISVWAQPHDSHERLGFGRTIH
ncbi:MAG TPA: hypothetical protein VLS45_10100, partial [Methylomicrobium sp.]|nr:hypothetical protein [Methylomicrobium sp.]